MIGVSWPQQGQKTGSSILRKVPVANGSGWYLKKRQVCTHRNLLSALQISVCRCFYYISVFPKMKAISYTSCSLKRNLNRAATCLCFLLDHLFPDSPLFCFNTIRFSVSSARQSRQKNCFPTYSPDTAHLPLQ